MISVKEKWYVLRQLRVIVFFRLLLLIFLVIVAALLLLQILQFSIIHFFLSYVLSLSYTHTHLPRTVMRAVCPSLITKADEVTETCIPESVVDNAHRPVSIFIGHDITVCRDQSHHRHVGCEKKKNQKTK